MMCVITNMNAKVDVAYKEGVAFLKISALLDVKRIRIAPIVIVVAMDTVLTMSYAKETK